MKITVWKNLNSRKGRIISDIAPDRLNEHWNNIPNMGNIKTDAPSESLAMMATRQIRLAVEHGGSPFKLEQRRGYQVISAVAEV